MTEGSGAMLPLMAGPLSQAGGWLAAFPDIGAVFVFAGSVMSLAGFAFMPRTLTLAAAVLGLALGGWGGLALAAILA